LPHVLCAPAGDADRVIVEFYLTGCPDLRGRKAQDVRDRPLSEVLMEGKDKECAVKVKVSSRQRD
jgi:hypothetical protein